MNTELIEFLARFPFRPEFEGHIGIEREHFLVDEAGVLQPRSPEFLAAINNPAWTYELSACQVEDRTQPHKDRAKVKSNLVANINEGNQVARGLGLRLKQMEVGPEDMPLTVYPDQRYQAMTATLPVEKLRAACRVAAVQIHYGVRDMDHALSVYNALVDSFDELVSLGDHSNGERIRLYATMAPNYLAPRYESLDEFYETARQQGFHENPKNCWHMVRITRHGTVETRMFGNTSSIDEIMEWVAVIQSIADPGDICTMSYDESHDMTW